MLPQELLLEVSAYLTPVEIQSLHRASRETCDATKGLVNSRDYMEWLAVNDRPGFHNHMGARLWQLEVERRGLDMSYRGLKCKGERGLCFTRANCHDDYIVYDKCIRMGWHDHISTLRCCMDSVADVDGMKIPVEGFPDSDNYYRREGIAQDNLLEISIGPTFTRCDLDVILGHMKRLQRACLDVVEAIKPIQHRHEIYTTYPGKLKRMHTALAKRIQWLDTLIETARPVAPCVDSVYPAG